MNSICLLQAGTCKFFHSLFTQPGKSLLVQSYISDVFGAHFTYKSQRAREPATNCGGGRREYHALEAPRSERARFAVAAASAASPACLSPPSSVLLIACKGKNNPSHSIRRRSEICIWEGRRRRREKVLPLPSLPPLPRSSPRLHLSLFDLWRQLSLWRERENEEEEESANSIWEAQETCYLKKQCRR